MGCYITTVGSASLLPFMPVLNVVLWMGVTVRVSSMAGTVCSCFVSMMTTRVMMAMVPFMAMGEGFRL